MAAALIPQGKENVPPGQKPRRMKMILAAEDEDAIVRLATPQKRKPLATAPVEAIAAPSLSIAIPTAVATAAADSDEEAVVVIKPRSPRSPSNAVPPAIAAEAQRILEEAPVAAPISVSVPATPPPAAVFDTPISDEPAPASLPEPIVEEAKAEAAEPDTRQLADAADEVATVTEVPTAPAEEAETSEETVAVADSTPISPIEIEQTSAAPKDTEVADAEMQPKVEDAIAVTEAMQETAVASVPAAQEEIAIVATEEVAAAKEEPVAPAAVEEAKEIAKPTETQAEVAAVAEDKSHEAPAIDAVEATKAVASEAVTAETTTAESKSAEEQRAEELAARSVARIEAEAAAQARRAQLEARLAELQTLNLPHSDAARATRTAVEERISAVEEAWRKRIEAKAPRTAAPAPASADAPTAAAATTAAPPPSPSIEERKQRIERLRAERLEMKMRLETSRANNGLQRREASKKKSLRWADDNGDRLTQATSYLVGERAAVSRVPPPLPETPAPTEIPARYLEI